MIKRTLYFGNPAYLSLKMKQMVVRVGGYSEQVSSSTVTRLK